LLLISTLSAPAAAGAPAKVLRYGTQKTPGYPSVLADGECCKRAGVVKATPLVDLEHFRFSLNREKALSLCFYAIPDAKRSSTFAGIALGPDFTCPPAVGFCLDDADAGEALMPSRRAGGGRTETRGARAPPPYFA
jgi:hypothetical protein